MLSKLFAKLGNFISEKDMNSKSTYVPRHGGKWVNQGKGVEDWVWVEKSSPLCYVIVSDDYEVSIERYSNENAIECIECLDTREAEVVAEHLREYYNSTIQEG